MMDEQTVERIRAQVISQEEQCLSEKLKRVHDLLALAVAAMWSSLSSVYCFEMQHLPDNMSVPLSLTSRYTLAGGLMVWLVLTYMGTLLLLPCVVVVNRIRAFGQEPILIGSRLQGSILYDMNTWLWLASVLGLYFASVMISVPFVRLLTPVAIPIVLGLAIPWLLRIRSGSRRGDWKVLLKGEAEESELLRFLRRVRVGLGSAVRGGLKHTRRRAGS